MNLNTVRVKTRIITVIFLAFFAMASLSWAATYYVDATNGNDSNGGVSQATSWKTIAKVRTSRLYPGDQVLFKRGEIWREQLTVPSSGSAGNSITFGAYGSGNKPKILGSVNLTGSSNWQQYASSTWKSAVTIPVDVGNLIFNNESFCGKKKSSLNSLGLQGDFYYDPTTGYLYIYSSSNPGSFYSQIEGARNMHGIITSGNSYITIQDMDFRYQGAVGVFVDGYAIPTNYIIVEHCNFSYIGGSYQMGTTRYGNAFQSYDTASHIIVRYNTFDQIYDAAMTTQGSEDSKTYLDHKYYYNIVTNSEYGFEFFIWGTGSTGNGIYVTNNVFYNNGGGWGHAQRPDPRGTGLMIWNSTNGGLSNCFFQNNIIHTSADQHIGVYDPNDLSGWTIDYNDYYPDGAGAFLRYATKTNFAAWKTATSQDAHSIFADPKLVSASDFHLQSASPAINAGTYVGLTLDFDGKSISSPPDIGALEFTQKPSKPLNLRVAY